MAPHHWMYQYPHGFYIHDCMLIPAGKTCIILQDAGCYSFCSERCWQMNSFPSLLSLLAYPANSFLPVTFFYPLLFLIVSYSSSTFLCYFSSFNWAASTFFSLQNWVVPDMGKEDLLMAILLNCCWPWCEQKIIIQFSFSGCLRASTLVQRFYFYISSSQKHSKAEEERLGQQSSASRI